MPAQITLLPEHVPEIKQAMPLMRLEAATVAPEKTIQGFVKAAAPQVEFKSMGNTGLLAGHDGERLVSFMNPATGESRVFPAMEGLKPGTGLAARANAMAARLVADESLFPKDGTVVTALPARTLVATNHVKGQAASAPQEYLSFIRFQRRVNGFPVFGPGTRAMVAVDADGAIRGFSHRWRKAAPVADKIAPITRAALVPAIQAHLSRGMSNAAIKVEKVTTGYYDGGGGVLQPVHKFAATIVAPPPSAGQRGAANSHVFGYVSIGAAAEPLPELGTLRGPAPAFAPARIAAPGPIAHAGAGDPTVGRYVVRNDTSEWVNSANEFLGGLRTANFLGSPIPFSDKQYYWAEPFEYVSNKDSFINSVNIALTESHGNWGLFTTKDNHEDIVTLNGIPASGYGGAGHSLAYWIIHSCEVIPTQTDESTSFDVWWNIFQGLHAVVGYRTEMWIDDDVTGPFGVAIGLGAPVVGAWLNEVASNDSYDDGDTYYDGNRKINEPMGRASAIAVAGHGGDTVNNLGSLGPAHSLTEWWFNN